MKIFKTIIAVALIAFGSNVYSQDTMYIHLKNGNIEIIPANNVDSLLLYNASPSSVTDVDGNVYQTATIGTQVWMTENLKVTKYNDGTAINLVTDNTAWNNLTTGAYCYNGNNIGKGATYGALYNWYAVSTGKVCPTGWHVPSDAEWTTLVNFVSSKGHSGSEGIALKSTTGWNSNGNGTDNFGFNGIPGGYRTYTGPYIAPGNFGYWWSSSEYTSNSYAWYRRLGYNFNDVQKNYNYKLSGFSVRCLKD